MIFNKTVKRVHLHHHHHLRLPVLTAQAPLFGRARVLLAPGSFTRRAVVPVSFSTRTVESLCSEKKKKRPAVDVEITEEESRP